MGWFNHLVKWMMKHSCLKHGLFLVLRCVYFRLPQGIHKIDEAFHICGVDALTDEKHLKRLGGWEPTTVGSRLGLGKKLQVAVSSVKLWER